MYCELVCLTTYLSGRLRALPFSGDSTARANPASSPPNPTDLGEDEEHACSPAAGVQVSSLPECIEEHNRSTWRIISVSK